METAYFPLVETVGDCAFQDCSSLETANFPSLTGSIKQGQFSGCPNLETALFPLVTTLGSSALASKKLATIDLSSVIEIGNFAFSDCTSLETVELPKAETIGSNAFRGCTALTTVDLPVAHTLSTYEMFYNCGKLTTLKLNSTETITMSYNMFMFGGTGANVSSSTKINLYLNQYGTEYGNVSGNTWQTLTWLSINPY